LSPTPIDGPAIRCKNPELPIAAVIVNNDQAPIVELFAISDNGKVRSHNEDSVLVSPALGLAVLADGMGGYNAGEVASGMATSLIGEGLAKAFADRQPGDKVATGGFFAHEAIVREVKGANEAIFSSAQSQPQYAGMGTTLVVSLFYGDTLTVAHLGDSRLYRLRGDQFSQVTRDHSLLQEQLDSGMITADEARLSVNRNLVTRALGVDPDVMPEICDHGIEEGDLYLMCSDGLNDMVEDEELALTLQSLGSNLQLCATQLVTMANDNGGRDNVSVILARVLRVVPRSRPWWQRLLAWFKRED
jgi:protein phosphatase